MAGAVRKPVLKSKVDSIPKEGTLPEFAFWPPMLVHVSMGTALSVDTAPHAYTHRARENTSSSAESIRGRKSWLWGRILDRPETNHPRANSPLQFTVLSTQSRPWPPQGARFHSSLLFEFSSCFNKTELALAHWTCTSWKQRKSRLVSVCCTPWRRTYVSWQENSLPSPRK